LQVTVSYLAIAMSNPLRQPSPDPAAVLTKAVLSAATRLGIKSRQLAEVIGTSEASVSRYRSGRLIDPASKQGELALLFLRLFRSLDALMGGDESKSRAWIRAENTHLGGVPAERIRRVEGLVDVIQYLDAMRGHL
jgi:transcriptional regulator with XRE-family HTH domain